MEIGLLLGPLFRNRIIDSLFDFESELCWFESNLRSLMSFRNLPRKKRSPIWLLPEDEFRHIIESSSTFTEALRAFGLENKGGNHTTLKQRMLSLGYTITKYTLNGRTRQMAPLIHKGLPLEVICVAESTYSRGSLKRRLIAESHLPYICTICGQTPEWNETALVLVLDHINGISTDNRLSNLRFLCPNCNSQQTTFAGRNSRRESIKD